MSEVIDKTKERRCSECEAIKPLSEFHSGHYWCKPCAREDGRRRRMENTPDGERDSNKRFSEMLMQWRPPKFQQRRQANG